MTKLILLILLAASFLGGYYLGRKPGSPDVIGWCRQTCQRSADTATHVAAVLRDASP